MSQKIFLFVQIMQYHDFKCFHIFSDFYSLFYFYSYFLYFIISSNLVEQGVRVVWSFALQQEGH